MSITRFCVRPSRASIVFAPYLLLVSLALCGCSQSGTGDARNTRPSPPTGSGDERVSADRLVNFTLTEIGGTGLTWKLDESHLEITNDRRPIRADLVEALGGTGQPQRIFATWQLSGATVLQLTDIHFDGERVSKQAKLTVSAAGPIRVNIDAAQYNMQYVQAGHNIASPSEPAHHGENTAGNTNGNSSEPLAGRPAGQPQVKGTASPTSVSDESDVLAQEMLQASLQELSRQPGLTPEGIRRQVSAAIDSGRAGDAGFLMLTAEQSRQLADGRLRKHSEKRLAESRTFLVEMESPLPQLTAALLVAYDSGTLSDVRLELLAQLLAAQARQVQRALGG